MKPRGFFLIKFTFEILIIKFIVIKCLLDCVYLRFF